MREDLIPFLARMRSKATDVDVCEATADRQIVQSFTLAELTASDETAADLVMDVCQRDAKEGRTGTVRYEVIASKNGQRLGRCAVSIHTGKSGEFSLDDANAQGVLIECMRDKRSIMAMAFAHQEELFKRLGQQLEMMSAEKKSVEESRLKMFDTLEFLLSNKSQREIETMKASTEAKATARLVEGIVPLLPAVATRVLGKATGTKNPLGDESIKALLSSLSEEQLEKIAPHLTQAQQVAMMEIMVHAQEAEEAAKAKVEEHVNGTAGSASHVVDEIPHAPTNANGGVG